MARPRKLTSLEEYAVYEMHKEGRPQPEIAYKFGIGTTTVFRIVRRVEKMKVEKKNE
jgi:hypothetical protein